jgi:hypothetical protein
MSNKNEGCIYCGRGEDIYPCDTCSSLYHDCRIILESTKPDEDGNFTTTGIFRAVPNELFFQILPDMRGYSSKVFLVEGSVIEKFDEAVHEAKDSL